MVNFDNRLIYSNIKIQLYNVSLTESKLAVFRLGLIVNTNNALTQQIYSVKFKFS